MPSLGNCAAARRRYRISRNLIRAAEYPVLGGVSVAVMAGRRVGWPPAETPEFGEGDRRRFSLLAPN